MNNVSNHTHFKWTGLTQTGQKIAGTIHAKNKLAAIAELRKQGIIVRKAVRKVSFIFSPSDRQIKSADITLFTKQMATLHKSGISLTQSFEIIKSGACNTAMKTLIETIKQDVGSGLMLAQALCKYPHYFNALFCNIIDAGEKSGSLDVMLDNLVAHQEKIALIKRNIKKILTYPIAVMVIAMLVICGFMKFIIPQFESLFNGFGAELPLITRCVIQLSAFFNTWWTAIVASITIVISALIYSYKHDAKFTLMMHQASLEIPLLGNTLQNASIARFTRTLAIIFSAGVSLTEALQSVSGSTGNLVYDRVANTIRDDVSNGQSLQHAMQNTHLFPQFVIQMITIGEESGTLTEMLNKVADFYEANVGNSIDTITSLLEPAIMTILGLLIGGIILAMYLPILTLGAVV